MVSGPKIVAGLLFVTLGVAVASTSVAAQTMDFGCPTAGTKFTLDNGDTRTVLSQVGMACKMQYGSGEKADFYALLHAITDARKDDPSFAKYVNPVASERIWPLSVGKRYRGMANLSSGSFTLDYVVVRHETINTAMGPQATYVIELNEVGTNGYGAKQIWWMSPAFKYPLKSEFSDSRGTKVVRSVVAVDK